MRNVIMFVSLAILAPGAIEAQEPRMFTHEIRTRMPLEAKTLKGAPYSAEMVTDHMQQLADGNRIVEHSTGRVYRDGEGRVRREEDRANGSPSISIVDPVAGVSYALDPEQRIAWKTSTQTGIAIMDKLEAAKIAEMKRRATQSGEAVGAIVQMRQKEEAARKHSGEPMTVDFNGGVVTLKRSHVAEQHKEEGLAPRTMEGIRVEGRRSTTTIAAGAIGNEWPITIVNEEWTSPDLQVLVLTERKDPRNGDSSYRLQHVVRGEPSALLFQVPSDYEIRESGIQRFEINR
jgi:hypothetical protein